MSRSVCVGWITPWNFPLHQISGKMAPALAAGCTVVLKPSEVAPGTVPILIDVLQQAGLPAGVVNVVHGEGPVVGAALAEHADVDMVSFTGSTRAGVAVARAAAGSVKRVTQELGGKSANILLDDVDLAKAVKAGVRGCFVNSGQACNAPTRMLVPAERLDEAQGIAAEVAAKVRVGDPFDEGSAMGPVVSQLQWERVQQHIQQGHRRGGGAAAWRRR